jgi:hypothetical protein
LRSGGHWNTAFSTRGADGCQAGNDAALCRRAANGVELQFESDFESSNGLEVFAEARDAPMPGRMIIPPERCSRVGVGAMAFTGEMVVAADNRGIGRLMRSPLASAAVEDTNRAATANATNGFIYCLPTGLMLCTVHGRRQRSESRIAKIVASWGFEGRAGPGEFAGRVKMKKI